MLLSSIRFTLGTGNFGVFAKPGAFFLMNRLPSQKENNLLTTWGRAVKLQGCSNGPPIHCWNLLDMWIKLPGFCSPLQLGWWTWVFFGVKYLIYLQPGDFCTLQYQPQNLDTFRGSEISHLHSLTAFGWDFLVCWSSLTSCARKCQFSIVDYYNFHSAVVAITSSL